MNTKQLQYVLTLAHEGFFSRAADALNISWVGRMKNWRERNSSDYLQDSDLMEPPKAEIIDYNDYYHFSRIKLKLKGLTSAKHRYQTLMIV